MPQLMAPDRRFHSSFLDAVREMIDEGLNTNLLLGKEIAEFGDRWDKPEAFAAYVAMLLAEREVPRRPDWCWRPPCGTSTITIFSWADSPSGTR